MSKLRVLIVEDDPVYALGLEMLVEELQYDLLGIIEESEAAIRAIQAQLPDLVLMDIHIQGDKNGIEVAESIQELNVPVIFLTNFKDEELYKKARLLSPIAYLIKPFDKLSLKSVIESSISPERPLIVQEANEEEIKDVRKEEEEAKPLFVRVNRQLTRVEPTDIEWVEAQRNYSILHVGKRNFILKMSLKKLYEILPADLFVQVHRNYLVQVQLIENIDLSEQTIHLGNQHLPISRTYKDELLERFNIL